MNKPSVTRTYGPIHFEDLDPHRFEDLIRELIYDYKEWQIIEATGRGGGDDGFDIRAYEKIEIPLADDEDEMESSKKIHPMDGNMWMIQGKRETSIGPKDIKEILEDVDSENPPYGYILAASANFSKKAYDAFREELRKKGVMEFYLWGKAELEDMLHLPKNDRILFTFFGYSLVSKRKSRATEIRSSVGIKNKLFKTLGSHGNIHESVLIRDINDTHYPFSGEYPNFDKSPRWKEFIAFSHHPLGLWCHNHKYFAYVDTEKKEWDLTRECDLIHRKVEYEEDRIANTGKQKLVQGVWKFFPKSKQGYFNIDCLIKYENISLVDDKGDTLHEFPHIYAGFRGDNGPFCFWNNTLVVNGEEFKITKDYKRVEIFPGKFDEPKLGKIHEKKIKLDSQSTSNFREYRELNAIYAEDESYEFLNSKDVVGIEDDKRDDLFIQITYKYKAKVEDYLKKCNDQYRIKSEIYLQLGHEIGENQELYIYEVQRISKWEVDGK
jgi:hypothetical protein